MDAHTFRSLKLFDRVSAEGDDREWVVGIGFANGRCTVYPVGSYGKGDQTLAVADAPAWTLVSRSGR